MICALGLDLDNTLYDHSQFVRGAYQDIALMIEAEFTIPSRIIFKQMYEKWKRLTSRANHIFTDTLKAHGIYSPELEKKMVQTFRAHDPKLSLFPGVTRKLEALKASGLRLGLLSDGQVSVQEGKLKALGLGPLFDTVIITGSLGRECYKPHPRGFITLANQLSVKPQKMIYIGDNPFVDFETPKKLGMITVRVRQGEYRKVPCDPWFVDKDTGTIARAIDWCVRQINCSEPILNEAIQK